MYLVDDHDEIMTQNLAQCLVHHRSIRFAADEIAKLPFNHAERRFDIGPLVIVRQEVSAPIGEVAERLFPQAPTPAGIRSAEGYERRGANLGDGLHIPGAGVPFIRRDFGNSKILCGSVYERRQHLGVSSVPLGNLNRCDYIRFHATHEMNLDPIVLLSDLAVLVVEPPMETR